MPLQPTKLFPEAPVWVTVPAHWPLVLKMTLSAPGEPPVKTPLVLESVRQYQRTCNVVQGDSLQGEFFVRAGNGEVEAFVVVVLVRIVVAAIGTAGLIVAVASIDSRTDL